MQELSPENILIEIKEQIRSNISLCGKFLVGIYNIIIVVVVVVILMAFLANLYPLRQLLYGYPILLYGVMLSIACACLLKWEETGVPGGNPRKHGENMQTPHRKARAGPETNPGPSCCEATALSTAPPCRPYYYCLALFVFLTGQREGDRRPLASPNVCNTQVRCLCYLYLAWKL